MTQKLPRISLLIFSLCAVLTIQAQTLPQPFIHYDFNNSDLSTTTALNKGSGGTALNGTLVNGSGSATALQNVAGVSNRAGDYAFNNSAATMAGAGGGVTVGNVRNAVSNSLGSANARSLTLSMWYYATDGALSGATRLAAITGGANPLELRNYTGEGRPAVTLSDKSFNPGADSAYAAVASWVYIAVAIDLTQSTNNTKFYVGSTEDAVSLLATGTISLSALSISNNLYLGNYTSALDRAFEGYIDDFRLYLSTADGSAALSLGQLEQLRQVAIPEPRKSAMYSLAVCVIGLMIVKRYRRSR